MGRLLDTQVTGADGVVTLSAVATSVELPSGLRASLGAAYPNPFAGATRVPFSVEQGGRVEAQVFDLLGRSVAVFAEMVAAGSHTLEVDLSGLAPGPYGKVVSIYAQSDAA